MSLNAQPQTLYAVNTIPAKTLSHVFNNSTAGLFVTTEVTLVPISNMGTYNVRALKHLITSTIRFPQRYDVDGPSDTDSIKLDIDYPLGKSPYTLTYVGETETHSEIPNYLKKVLEVLLPGYTEKCGPEKTIHVNSHMKGTLHISTVNTLYLFSGVFTIDIGTQLIDNKYAIQTSVGFTPYRIQHGIR